MLSEKMTSRETGQPRLAALPPHSAVRLSLTVKAPKIHMEAAPPIHEAEPQKIRDKHRKGEAFPHCAAAKPQIQERS